MSYTTCFKLAIVCVLSLSLSACLLTDDFKKNLIEENNQIAIKDVSKRVDDIEKITPQLNRIIELESNLLYLTSLLESEQSIKKASLSPSSRLSSLDNIVSQQDKGNKFEASTAEEIELQAALPPLTQSVQMSRYAQQNDSFDKFSDLKSSTSQAELVPANISSSALLPANTASQVNTLDAESIDNKFSQQASYIAPPVRPKKIVTPKLKVQDIVGDIKKENQANNTLLNHTCAEAGDNASKYSIHLASYKSTENAKSGWDQLMSKHKNLLCNLSPRLAQVSVNGNEYLSLRVGPLLDKNSALALCSAIKSTGDYCASAEFVGRQL